jgi:hypothetical protein
MDQSNVPNFLSIMRVSWQWQLCLATIPHIVKYNSAAFGCDTTISILSGSAFGNCWICLHWCQTNGLLASRLKHHSGTSTWRILDLTAILWLSIYGNTHRQPMINPTPPLPIPAGDWLINTNHVGGLECSTLMIIVPCCKAISKFPSAALWTHTFWTLRRLFTPAETLPYVIKPAVLTFLSVQSMLQEYTLIVQLWTRAGIGLCTQTLLSEWLFQKIKGALQ